ncbi:MAG: 4Fe-4S dicluster domain-containing protein [Candidatus Hydrogenedentota bacterium]|nr:MAG: 4Fe-4S dicluster domain-containing protein [Candidatus Hydrogenedentota bacterium]
MGGSPRDATPARIETEKNSINTSGSRRRFLGSAVASLTAFLGWKSAGKDSTAGGFELRPPGALSEKDFLEACVRCFRCAEACPNDCIRFHGLGKGLRKAFTPFIEARERGCILCGECAKACPSGALVPFQATRDGWLASVKMGTARVNKSMCYSYNGRTCGVCYRACPLAGQAMTIGVFETPIVHPEACVGCGLCEQSCVHVPQAIRVIPEPSEA